VFLRIALILVRSSFNPDQSESEIRTDNFTMVLFTVPVIITSDITSRSWVVTWKLGFVINRMQCPNVASL
jgi:hypothetical protein